jgi:hypothetical protein
MLFVVWRGQCSERFEMGSTRRDLKWHESLGLVQGCKRDCRLRLQASPQQGISDGAEGILRHPGQMFVYLFVVWGFVFEFISIFTYKAIRCNCSLLRTLVPLRCIAFKRVKYR